MFLWRLQVIKSLVCSWKNNFFLNIPFHLGSDAVHDAEKLNNLLEILLGNQIILDGTLATDSSQAKVTVDVESIAFSLVS